MTYIFLGIALFILLTGYTLYRLTKSACDCGHCDECLYEEECANGCNDEPPINPYDFGETVIKAWSMTDDGYKCDCGALVIKDYRYCPNCAKKILWSEE